MNCFFHNMHFQNPFEDTACKISLKCWYDFSYFPEQYIYNTLQCFCHCCHYLWQNGRKNEFKWKYSKFHLIGNDRSLEVSHSRSSSAQDVLVLWCWHPTAPLLREREAQCYKTVWGAGRHCSCMKAGAEQCVLDQQQSISTLPARGKLLKAQERNKEKEDHLISK